MLFAAWMGTARDRGGAGDRHGSHGGGSGMGGAGFGGASFHFGHGRQDLEVLLRRRLQL